MAENNSLLYIDKLVHEYKQHSLFIPTLTTDDLEVEPERCGIKGSPTKVFKVESVVLGGGSHEKIDNSRQGLSTLVDRLIEDHILG